MGLPTTIEMIRDEEIRLDCPIPEIIKSMLLENNGGSECIADGNRKEVWNLYVVKDTRSRKHIIRSANNIERETISMLKWDDFPKDGVVLGTNGYGDQLIVRRGLPSTIIIWRHETRLMYEANIMKIVV